VILDLFSRRVVGWKLGETLEAELVVTALRNALSLRQPTEGLYFHSDRGGQYSSQALRKPLSVIGAHQSMSGSGNCYDSATMEAFFSTLKTECFPGNQVFNSRPLTGSPPARGPGTCRSKAKAKNPRGFGGQSHWFTLIGTIGKSEKAAFIIGCSLKYFQPVENGRLYCFANDLSFMYWNNSGTVTVRVTRAG